MAVDTSILYEGKLVRITPEDSLGIAEKAFKLEIQTDDGDIKRESFYGDLNQKVVGHRITFRLLEGATMGIGWGTQRITDRDDKNREYSGKFGP